MNKRYWHDGSPSLQRTTILLSVCACVYSAAFSCTYLGAAELVNPTIPGVSEGIARDDAQVKDTTKDEIKGVSTMNDQNNDSKVDQVHANALSPLAVTLGKCVFDEGFAKGLGNWQVEAWEDGDAVRTSIANGGLTIETKSETHGMMLWSRRELPDDFRFEFDFTPLSDDGFFLIFFCYRGKDGLSILEDPHWSNRKFSTLFKKYTKGDSNGYHISFRRGEVADCNFRKNAGQKLMRKVILEEKLLTGKTVHVTLDSKDGRSVLRIGDTVFMDYTDSDNPYSGGHIGLRQVYDSKARYENIKITELK